ncbi:MAG: hypothetical protein ACYDG3_10035, partial [Bacillati bacterium]
MVGGTITTIHYDDYRDCFTICGTDPDGNSVNLNIPATVMANHIDSITTILAERRDKLAYIESLPQCDVCGHREEDGDAYEYKSLKMCARCYKLKSPADLDVIIARSME